MKQWKERNSGICCGFTRGKQGGKKSRWTKWGGGGRGEGREEWQRKRNNRKRHFYSFSNQSDAPISGIKTNISFEIKTEDELYIKDRKPERAQQREHVNEASFSVQHRLDSLLSVGAPGVLNVKRVRECIWTVSSTCLHSRKKVTMVTVTSASLRQQPKAFCTILREDHKAGAWDIHHDDGVQAKEKETSIHCL